MDFDKPHRRFNPLTNEFILVSPHRAKRPWLGQAEQVQAPSILRYDPGCYLCPGNSRANGQRNPDFNHTFSFPNDFSAVFQSDEVSSGSLHPLLVAEPIHGACDVVVFHPRHDLTLPRMELEDIKRVIDEWIQIYCLRGSQEGIKYVQIFENKGMIMGCSNPHPHGQIWSLSEVPTLPSVEISSFKTYTLSNALRKDPGRGSPCLLCDYVHLELDLNQRLVFKNDHWIALVPWWAIWPFETLVLPHRRHISSIADLTDGEKCAFADILSKITIRYDNLFNCSFPYSMGIHQRPTPSNGVTSENGDEENSIHLHLHFSPPLLRDASVKKFLVGFELMAEAQRDITPEQAAEKLRECSDIHYLESSEPLTNLEKNAM